MGEVNPSKGEQTRQDILDAAQRLFFAQGYTATTMRQIARAVGITPAAIYNHFSGKEEIFVTLLRQAAPFDELFALLRGAEGNTPDDLLAAVIRGIVGLLATRHDYVRLALIDAQERDGATLGSFLPYVFPEAMAFYQRLATLDVAHGRLRDISPPILIRTLVSLIAGFWITETVIKPAQALGLPLEEWVDGLVDICLHGVLKSE